jgi:hypothetical protein
VDSRALVDSPSLFTELRAIRVFWPYLLLIVNRNRLISYKLQDCYLSIDRIGAEKAQCASGESVRISRCSIAFQWNEDFCSIEFFV